MQSGRTRRNHDRESGETEAFYVAESREAQSDKAKAALDRTLGPMGIVIEKVLTNDYRFNDEYTKAIEDKKVANQQMEKNKSAQHAALLSVQETVQGEELRKMM